jgi:hypothetical protein
MVQSRFSAPEPGPQLKPSCGLLAAAERVDIDRERLDGRGVETADQAGITPDRPLVMVSTMVASSDP